MRQTLEPEATPDPGSANPDRSGTPANGQDPAAAITASPNAHTAAASRGLFFVAALLIIVPAAIGLFVLRSRSTPTASGGFDPAFVLPTPATGDPDEGLTSSDLLQPGGPAPTGRIRYITDGEPGDLANGGIIDLGGDVQLQVWVSPFPPTEFTTDVDLVLTTVSGVPIGDATITTDWDMVMSHGPYFSTFQHVGDGLYRTDSFDFFMFGPWQLDITIESPAGPASVKLAVLVWPE